MYKRLYNRNVKNIMKYLIALMLLIQIITPAIAASPGVGLVYGMESDIVNSNQNFCVIYGLYNPFDIDSRISLAAEGAIGEFVTSSDSILVPSGIGKDDALSAKICYKTPDLRTKKCTIPFILCKYECEILEKSYKGQVLASPTMPSELEGSGSSVGMSVAAPFTLLVKCTDDGYDYVPIILLISGIFALILTIIFLKRISKKHGDDKKQRMQDQWQSNRSRPPIQPPIQPPQRPPQPPQQPPQPQPYLPQPQRPPQPLQQFRPRL
jgi:hypothetical protein